MQSPPLILNKEIVGPLLSHREWKSFLNHPCSEPLYSMYVTNFLSPNSFCKYSFSSFSVAHFELARNSLIIEAKTWLSVGLGSGFATRGLGFGSKGIFFGTGSAILVSGTVIVGLVSAIFGRI